MSPIDRESVESKLFRLKEATRIVEELIDEEGEKIIKNERLKGTLYFNLVVSIEAILDVGNHILAESFNKPGSSYADIIINLGEKGIIPKEFAEANEKMGDFRNKIIHDYDRINDEQAYEYAKKAPEIFKIFAKNFINFVEKGN